MKFRRRWFSGRYESDEGFSIAFDRGRAGMTYRDGGLVVIIDGEAMAERTDGVAHGWAWALYTSGMSTTSDGKHRLDDDALRGKIVSRIKALFDFYDWQLYVG